MGVVKAGGKEVRKEKGADIPLLEYTQFLTLKNRKNSKSDNSCFFAPVIFQRMNIFPLHLFCILKVDTNVNICFLEL